MKIAVTGHDGNVGTELMKREGDYTLIPITADITNLAHLSAEIDSIDPDIVLHLAALTDVDECELDPNKAIKINSRGTYNVATCCANKRLVYLSTDHVFRGNYKNPPWEYHRPDPENRYGLSKWGGEQVLCTFPSMDILIVRTSKLFTRNDVLSILPTTEYDYWEVTGIINRTFMYLPHFVTDLLDMVTTDKWDNINRYNQPKYYPKVLHISGFELKSYYEFYSGILRKWGIENNLIERKHEPEGYSPRPHSGGLNTTNAQGLGLPRRFLDDALEEIKNEN